jgi:hypothetical protein
MTLAASPSLRMAGGGARLRLNLGLMLLSLVLFAAIGAATGRINVREGRGWDGGEYAGMLEEGWDQGTANTALRPLVVMLARPAFQITGDALTAFRVMNYAYVAVLCFALCLLFDQYSNDAAAKTLLIVNVLLSIATLKYVAFYPMLIDTGAYAIITAAIYLVVSGRRIAAAVACVAAVLSREFAVAVIAFGIVRDLRRRAPLWTILATYGPAAAVFLGWRAIVASQFNDGNDEILTLSRLVANLEQWYDPTFVAFFVYFLLTLFGGVTLFVLGKFGLAARHLRREPEWAVFMLAVIAPALFGSADIWRYLAYLLPAVAVLFAVCARDIGLPRRRIAVALIICAATVITQRPFQAIDMPTYFRDWFPYYVHLERLPPEAGDPEIWPFWGWQFLGAAGLWWLLAAFPAVPSTNPDAHHA